MYDHLQMSGVTDAKGCKLSVSHDAFFPVFFSAEWLP